MWDGQNSPDTAPPAGHAEAASTSQLRLKACHRVVLLLLPVIDTRVAGLELAGTVSLGKLWMGPGAHRGGTPMQCAALAAVFYSQHYSSLMSFASTILFFECDLSFDPPFPLPQGGPRRSCVRGWPPVHVWDAAPGGIVRARILPRETAGRADNVVMAG